MKKIIAAVIRFLMPKVIEKHEREKKARRIHNANVMQELLDNEHEIRDKVNARFDAVYTTREALKVAYRNDMGNYHSYFALQEADFR